MAKILIVDDSKMARTLLETTLVNLGHEVIGTAVNGLDGHDKYFALKPDIITIDITMPMLDGITCMKIIKEKDPNARIIMVTSNAQRQKLKEAIDTGVDGYVVKPFTEEDLRIVLDKILK